MLSYEVKEALNKSNDWAAAKNKLGDLVHRGLNVAKGVYDFAKEGGAQGTFNLKDIDGESLVKVPAGAVAMNVLVYAETGLTSGGAATVDVQLEGANDLLAAAAYTALDTGDKVQGIPDFATVADYVVTTAERTLQLSVNDADLTAGKLLVFVFYVF